MVQKCPVNQIGCRLIDLIEENRARMHGYDITRFQEKKAVGKHYSL